MSDRLSTEPNSIERCIEAVLDCERREQEILDERDVHVKQLCKLLNLPRKANGRTKEEQLRYGGYLITVKGDYVFPHNSVAVTRLEDATVKCIDTPNGQPAHTG